MENKKISASYAFAALKFYPTEIQDDILNLTTLAAEVGIPMNTFVSFGIGQSSFSRDILYEAFRHVFDNPTDVLLAQDSDQQEWAICVDSYDEARIQLRLNDKSFVVSEFYGLHPQSNVRHKCLLAALIDLDLPVSVNNFWQNLAAQGPLSNDAMASLFCLLDTAPGYVKKRIIDEVKRGKASYNIIIPDDFTYYQNLIGGVGECTDITSYSTSILKPQFAESIKLHSSEWLKRVLRMSWHHDIVAQINTSKISHQTLLSIIEWAKVSGDAISKVGAIQLSIPFCNEIIGIDVLIVELIESIRDDDLSEMSPISQLSDIMVLVGGELTRKSLFLSKPPFWRRLASFTHAAVLQGCLWEANYHASALAENSCNGRARHFLVQTMVDLRTEPRWLADYLSPSILKSEFLSRILLVTRYYQDILTPKLQNCIFGENGIESRLSFPYAYLPGPLEGGLDAAIELPDEIAKVIYKQLSQTPVELSAFAALINSAMIFKIDKTMAEMASQAIKATKYQVRVGKHFTELNSTLTGLASVAAATRSIELANDVLLLVLALRSSDNEVIGAFQALSICLISAAANRDLNSWSEFIGKASLEIAYQNLTAEEAHALIFILHEICRIVPSLWLTCGKAIAALESIPA